MAVVEKSLILADVSESSSIMNSLLSPRFYRIQIRNNKITVKNRTCKPSYKVYVATFFTHLTASVSIGVGFGWTAPALQEMTESFSKQNPTGSSPLRKPDDDALKSWIASIILLGALLGAIVNHCYLEHCLGPRLRLLFSGLIFCLGFILIGVLNNSVWLVLLGRLVSGLATGIATITSIQYLEEILTLKLRFWYSRVMTDFCLFFGYFYVDLLAHYYHYSWNQLALMGLVFTGLGFVGMLLMPESPVWLVKNNQRNLARNVLKDLRTRHSNVDAELDEMVSELQESEPSNPVSYLKWINYLGCLIIFQQLTGIQAVMFYLNDIFLIMDVRQPRFWALVCHFFMLLATLSLGLVFKRLGLRTVFFISVFGMMISISVLGLYHKYHSNPISMNATILSNLVPTTRSSNVSTAKTIQIIDRIVGRRLSSWLPMLCLSVFISSWPIGVGQILWALITEWGQHQTEKAVQKQMLPYLMMLQWVVTFIVIKEFLQVQKWIGVSSIYWLFGAICLLLSVFVCFLFFMFGDTTTTTTTSSSPSLNKTELSSSEGLKTRKPRKNLKTTSYS